MPRFLLAAPIALIASPVRAGGGADVVDDAAVEIPGTCHLESWITGSDGHSGLANLSPGCTPATLPSLEVGAAIQRTWDGRNQTVAGPALKLALNGGGRRWSTALDLAGNWNLKSGRLENASAVLPLTLTASRSLTLSVNAGYSYVRPSRRRQALFWGAQAEAQIARDVTLMLEGFGRSGGRAGAQAGLRWTPHCGHADIDVLVGRYADGANPTAVTVGLTLRR